MKHCRNQPRSCNHQLDLNRRKIVIFPQASFPDSLISITLAPAWPKRPRSCITTPHTPFPVDDRALNYIPLYTLSPPRPPCTRTHPPQLQTSEQISHVIPRHSSPCPLFRPHHSSHYVEGSKPTFPISQPSPNHTPNRMRKRGPKTNEIGNPVARILPNPIGGAPCSWRSFEPGSSQKRRGVSGVWSC